MTEVPLMTLMTEVPLMNGVDWSTDGTTEGATAATIACSWCRCSRRSGCGQHVEQVLAGLPAAQRCDCAPVERPAGSWRRLFRRS